MFTPLAISVLGLFAAQPAAASEAQPNVMILAQAQDRCMTTYAVRLTRTEAADEEIFAQANEGCRQLTDQLHAAIAREYPADQARELVAALQANARPNFLTMLQRIRADRQRRSGN
jgi:Na+-translocating ferredoxin:NAD+ oxidoreductase RnfC subunit